MHAPKTEKYLGRKVKLSSLDDYDWKRMKKNQTNISYGLKPKKVTLVVAKLLK